jgi:D-3-phosphoglycerate dehydrogenase / 2-oxoglutarate reductase
MSTIFVAIESIRSNGPALDKLRQTFDHVVLASSRSRAMEELASTAGTVDALLIGVKEPITPEILESLPKLRAIASITTGTDHIAADAAAARGIALLTAPGANARAVAEHALTLILALTKELNVGNGACRAGLDWAGLPHLPQILSGRPIGLLGCGATARELIQLLTPFRCSFKIWTRDPAKHSDLSDRAEFCSLEEVFSVSSVVSVHLPLTRETRGLVDGKLMKLLSQRTILINVARLKLFDVPSVLAALKERTDIRLGIDALALKAAGFCELASDRIVTTPHIAGITTETLRLIEDIVVEKLVALFGKSC